MRVSLVASICAAVALSGCGDDDDEQDGSTIAYSRTGGIAGISESLEIDERGAATLSTGPAGGDGRVTTFRIGSSALEEITEALEAAEIERLDDGVSSDCFDCFQHELRVGDETAVADDSTVSEEFLDAVAPLEAVIERRSE